MARKKASSAAAASAATPVSVPVDALAQELPVLESDSFDCNAYIHSKCHPISEKGVRKLYSEVLQLKRQFADIVRKNVYANYTSFIWATQTIADLEGSLHGVQNLLSSQAAGIQGLRDIFPLSTLLTNDHETIVEESSFSEDEPDLSDAERSARGLQNRLEVFLAEKKVDEALAALKMGEQMVREQDRKNLRGSLSPTTVASLQVMLSYMRDRLVKELVEATQKPSVCGTELRAAVSALDRLGDGAHAHSLLLSSHLKRLRHHIKNLRPSGTSYGGAYTAALSQLVFSAIAQATKDSGAVFGPENTYASELFLWACQVIKMFVVLVKRHVLSSSAAAGGLRAAAECVQIALGHCLLLENQGLVLCPFLSSQVRPSVKQALQANVKRIAENTTALAAADDWVLTSFPRNSRTRRQSLSSITDSTSTPRFQLSSSAHNFYSMIQKSLLVQAAFYSIL
ncbi:hypothetical protein O6H91_07G049400 [Diphasiastrum complanatum]|uniref:Uncharacterized protein n=1 Tax=Diphasiastrum complanatum TaxID=34168 RepID=A0ACC2D4Z3_DIPCM|nr:hypothetical protein O6H91_07G049400 [Diphasiastrum complanatum]